MAEYELYIDGDAKNVTEGKVSFEKGPGEYDFKFVWEKDNMKFEQSKKVTLTEWQNISTDSLSQCIQGGVNADQLRSFLNHFPDSAGPESIMNTFVDDAFHIILDICECEETMQGDGIFYTYVYNLGAVNNVLSGLVDYRMDANTSYSEILYTDNNNLYITIPPTDWMTDYVMDNLRATSNGKILIVYYDVNEVDYSAPSNTSFKKTMRAVFEKQSSGKYKLRRIENA